MLPRSADSFTVLKHTNTTHRIRQQPPRRHHPHHPRLPPHHMRIIYIPNIAIPDAWDLSSSEIDGGFNPGEGDGVGGGLGAGAAVDGEVGYAGVDG